MKAWSSSSRVRTSSLAFKQVAGELTWHRRQLPAVSSLTAQDMLEFHLHGSTAVMKRILATLGGINGLRPAGPGEFTRLAFDNGRMDLTEVEGLRDLIESETEAQRALAVRQAGVRRYLRRPRSVLQANSSPTSCALGQNARSVRRHENRHHLGYVSDRGHDRFRGG